MARTLGPEEVERLERQLYPVIHLMVSKSMGKIFVGSPRPWMEAFRCGSGPHYTVLTQKLGFKKFGNREGASWSIPDKYMDMFGDKVPPMVPAGREEDKRVPSLWELSEDGNTVSVMIGKDHRLEIHRTDEGIVLDTWPTDPGASETVFSTYYFDAELTGDEEVR